MKKNIILSVVVAVLITGVVMIKPFVNEAQAFPGEEMACYHNGYGFGNIIPGVPIPGHPQYGATTCEELHDRMYQYPEDHPEGDASSCVISSISNSPGQ